MTLADRQCAIGSKDRIIRERVTLRCMLHCRFTCIIIMIIKTLSVR